MQTSSNALFTLEKTILDRLGSGDSAASYVASLGAKGRGKIAQKLGEEAVETIIAAMGDDASAITSEAADLVFHLTVLLAHSGVAWADVLAEIEQREGVSGLDEKASRTP